MFNTISWESFLYSTLLLAGGYYFITTFLLYHKEITSWFKSKPVAITTTAPQSSEDPADHHTIMGSISPEEDWLSQRSSVVNAEEVRVTELNTEEMPDPIQTPGENELLNGSVADLMQEIKTLLQMVADYKSSKEEYTPLFIALFGRYPHLRNTAYQQAINRHICEEGKTKFSIDLQLLEVRSWWETSHNR